MDLAVSCNPHPPPPELRETGMSQSILLLPFGISITPARSEKLLCLVHYPEWEAASSTASGRAKKITETTPHPEITPEITACVSAPRSVAAFCSWGAKEQSAVDCLKMKTGQVPA